MAESKCIILKYALHAYSSLPMHQTSPEQRNESFAAYRSREDHKNERVSRNRYPVKATLDAGMSGTKWGRVKIIMTNTLEASPSSLPLLRTSPEQLHQPLQMRAYRSYADWRIAATEACGAEAASCMFARRSTPLRFHHDLTTRDLALRP